MEKNVTIRYSDAELAEFEVIIKEKLGNAKKELDFMREQIIELHENSSNQQGGDYFDDSSLHTELEMLNQMVSRQRQFVQNLENAQIRIKNKSYGICISTGELIDKKRLLLVPHATKSVEAKNIEAEKLDIKQASTHLDTFDSMDRERETEREAPTRSSRIITKIVKKPTGTKKAPIPLDDDDADLFEPEEIVGTDEDYDYEDDIINVDIEDFPDDTDESDNMDI
ncbi:MAG TPA: TraR/DksA C4-type zinc finger protein [Saprospiraceae bacterium]|nr:TraR/DksA C4-type zinc finger protein [Saprospiraceae bacterium]